MSLALRPVFEFPSGLRWEAQTLRGHLDVVASKEIAQKVQLTGTWRRISSDPIRSGVEWRRMGVGGSWVLAHAFVASPNTW